MNPRRGMGGQIGPAGRGGSDNRARKTGEIRRETLQSNTANQSYSANVVLFGLRLQR